MRNDFEERKQARIERFEALAEKAETQSNEAYEQVDRIASFIPMGQPILVGHHSEKRHRRDIEKMDNGMRKSVELSKKADYYADRAKSAASNNAIFSDDPNAAEKLADKIARLEARQELMKAANKLCRAKDINGLIALGFTPERSVELVEGNRWGDRGYQQFELTNNNANIRRLKDRLARQVKLDALETNEKAVGDVRVVNNADANRTQMFFPNKPSDNIRTELKRNGFRWSPSEGAWQRHISNGAMYHAERIAKLYTEEV